ncbi:MAG TPA: ABC transporter permease [Thermoanaerobaculia bacterium]|nr:ABC transporter permease [Thermoanaerobaculia bacterium]
MLSDLVYRLRALFRRRAVEAELDDELRFHCERAIEKHMRAGRTREEAVRLTRLEFGGLDQVKDACREARGIGAIETLLRDVAYGLRMLRNNPGFSAVAVLTLAIGIGANTALFSVIDGVLLKPLPFTHPDQLVRLHESKPNFAAGSISYPNFRDWQRQNHTFSAIAISRGSGFSLTGRGEAEQVSALVVSSDYFSLLGVRPLLGRTFGRGEDEIGAAPLVLVSEALWRRKLGAAPDAPGKSLTLDGRDFQIAGVIPASFGLRPNGPAHPDVWVPVGQWQNPLLRSRAAGLGFHGIGRLQPGVTLAQARADMERITRNLAAAYPEADKGIGAKLAPLKDELVGDVRPFLLLLLGAVGFVLLIACVNVANLLLARSTGRAGEFAVRAALGASQGRLVRQMLTECGLLAAVGGGLGVLIAAWGTRAALGVLPAALPRAEEIRLDARVLLFSLAVSLAAAVLFGLVPALKMSRTSWHQTLKEGGRGAMGGRQRAQDLFVMVEVALALVLLVGAGLMLRCLGKLWSVDPGFRPDHVLTANIALPPALMTASPGAVRAAWRAIDERLASLPGFVASSLGWGAVPLGTEDEVLFWLDGRPRPASENEWSWAVRYVVGPGYLRTLRIPLLRGRFFDAHDDERSAPVAVIDEVFAKTLFGDRDPLHQRLNLTPGANFADRAEIVGVVGHVKQWGLDRDGHHPLRTQIYLPFMQMPDAAMVLTARNAGVMVRSAPGAPAVFANLRRVLAALSPEHEVYGVQTMDEIVSASLAPRQFSMILLGCFALLALALASIGIYGVTSYLVGQRTHEIGVRIALGARRGNLLRMVFGQGLRTALLGAAIGLVAALGLTQLMSRVLYGVSATDPWTFAGVVAVLISATLAACFVPASRAMGIDPTVALRRE